MRKINILLAGVILCALCSAASAQPKVLNEGDVIKVTVHYHEELNTTARINEEGGISFPLIGNVSVAGLTVEQTASKIRSLLSSGYLVNPQVSVFVEQYRKVKGVVIGEVTRPGLYELEQGTKLFELISKAGGLTENAGDKAVIRRKELPGGEEKIITVDLKALIEQGDMAQNTDIQDGDNIYISRAGVFYVIGEVKRPDAYKFTKGTTVIKAITLAGGFTDRANPEKVKLIRKVNGTEETIEQVLMDEVIMPEDLIVVPESLF